MEGDRLEQGGDGGGESRNRGGRGKGLTLVDGCGVWSERGESVTAIKT